MFLDAGALGATRLDLSRIAAALHIAAERATLELFAPDGRLMLVATTNRLETPAVLGAWTMPAWSSSRRALVVVGRLKTDGEYPSIRFTHRGRQVRGRLTRLGPFWLAEAGGRQLRLDVHDGRFAIAMTSRRRPGPVSFHLTTTRLEHPFHPAQETS